MKTYKTLIKLSQQELDRLRRELNVFLEKRDELISQHERLGEKLVEEGALMEKAPEIAYTYSDYSINIKNLQENINLFVAKLDSQVDSVSEEIIDAFAELKKYEIMLETKEKELAAEIARKEGIDLDEVGMNLHRRKIDN